MANQYVGSTKWTAVTAWAALTLYNVGDLRRQLAAPTVGNERVWRCTTAGTSGSTEPSWTLTAGSTTNDATVVWTEVTGLTTYNSGGAWGAPHARLANSLASGWAVSGDTVKVHESHDGNQATAITLTMPGTTHTAITRIVCVNDADTARATTAIERVTGDALLTIRGGPSAGSLYGLTFKSAKTTNNAIDIGSINAAWIRFEACLLELTAAAAVTIDLDPGTGGGMFVEWVNTKVKFAHAGQFIRPGLRLLWRDTATAIQGTVPTASLFQIRTAGAYPNVECRNVDLSALVSGSSLVQTTARVGDVLLVNCKLGASVVITSGTPTVRGGVRVRAVNSDSADTNYRYAGHLPFIGSVVSETTIVKTSGASDGTTPISQKMVTTADAKLDDPLFTDWMTFWNETIGSSVTVAIPLVTDNVTLTNAEAWIEVEYLGTSGFSLGVPSSSRITDPIYGSPANVPTDGVSSWTTTGLTTPVKQLPTLTFTPQEKGIIRARVCVARASTTVYHDLKILSTSGRQYQSGGPYINEGASGGGSIIVPNIFDNAIIRGVPHDSD